MIFVKYSMIPVTLFCLLSLYLIGHTSLVYGKDDPPIYIEADHMTSIEKNGSVLFKGNVDAKQGEVRIRSDEMTVYYTQKKKSTLEKSPKIKGQQKVEKIVCVGNVEVTKKEWLGTSKKMYYISKKRQVILIDNAKAWQGQNMVSGDKIIYYLDENRSEVIGSTKTTITDKSKKKSSRVKMTIIPGQ